MNTESNGLGSLARIVRPHGCKRYSTVDELVADTCSPSVMMEYARITAPPKALMESLRMQVHQLEMTMLCGGPSEICGAIDAVESAVHELRELVSPNDPSSPHEAGGENL